ncbi:MAG TPA: cation-translocating P-type ATPase, partial [Acidimicrobiales bacterium]|nr:cation-translocating P-type ATPase [Acidimicrobiales bacterium]
MDVPTVLSELGTSPEGLDPQSLAARRTATTREPPPLALRLPAAVAAELANPLTPLLGVGAGLAAAVGSVTDAALLASVTGVNALVGGVQRLRAEVSIERLKEVSTDPVTVRRSGATELVQRDQLVPGDVVELDAGDLVPADCRILEAVGCEVDESVVTGESLPVLKHSTPTPGADVADRLCMLYEGTTVSTGRALAVVVAVGADTEVGASLADAPEPPPSGVEARLSALTLATVPATVASGIAVGAISFLRGRLLRQAVTSGVSLMVAAVPEGLPVLASVAQLSSARRLSKRGALVRNPRTIEALGRVDTLCFDKTGTLTLGEIRVQRVSDGQTEERIDQLTLPRRAVLAAAVRASPEDRNGPHATDRAILASARSAGVSAADGMGGWRALGELAFDPARGYHAVVGTGPAGNRVSVKGAPEVLLPRCTSWSGPDGSMPITQAVRRRLDAEADRLARRGLRVLAVAERASSERAEVADERVHAMELVGFIGLADSVRPTAATAVADLRAAGIDIVMITGDHPSTARAIGNELDIVDGHRVLTGPDLEHMSDAELEGAVEDISIFARITPKDKVRIVRAYQRVGRVVAMTGDGANDAPAIRLADAGIALGERCSPAAREAADLVVVDDRIETIQAAVVEGRALWASVRDAVAILVGGNLGEVAFTLGATAVTGASPLNPRQLLLVNMLTDMLPAITIAMKPPPGRTPEMLLHEGPDASLGSALTDEIALRALTTAGGAFGAWLVARGTGTARRASTISLLALVGTQLGQTAVVGWRTPLVPVAAAFSAATLAAIVQTPGVSQFFGCTPLGPIAWGIGVGASTTATGLSVAAPWLFDRFGRTPSSVLGEIFDIEALRR